MKTLYDISWQVDEKTYREDKSYSYSLLARYERGGFDSIPTLFEKKSSPSLTFGSAVDAIITGGYETFNDMFIVVEAKTTDSGEAICQNIKKAYTDNMPLDITQVPRDILDTAAKEAGFWSNDKWNAIRVKKALEIDGIKEYYTSMVKSEGKQILSQQEYDKVIESVDALINDEATKFWFEKDTPFDERYKRYYQLKFKSNIDGIDFKIMADLIVVDYENKCIYPVDLKTSSKHEWDFFKSFIDWNYSIQARLYYNVLKDNILKDDYFKDFEIKNYRFIVINKDTRTPLVWEYEDTKNTSILYYGKTNQIVCRDPVTIAKELDYYLTVEPNVPIGVKRNNENSLIEKLNNL